MYPEESVGVAVKSAARKDHIDRDQAEQVAKEDDAERMNFACDQPDDDAVHGGDERVSGHEQGTRDDRGYGVGSHAGSGTGAASHFGRGVAFMSCRV